MSKIFISWSKGRSLTFAQALRRLMEKTLHDPSFKNKDKPGLHLVAMSEDLPKGGNWFQNLAGLLEDSKAGILCVTPENRMSPWLLFEAGALIRCDFEVALFPLLLDLPPTSLDGPLGLVQSTVIERDVAAIKRETFALLQRVVDHVNRVANPSKPFYVEPPPPPPKVAGAARANDPWEEFANKVLRIPPPPLASIFDRFSALFERKTFQEPFQDCADQRWLDRYAGARLAREEMDARKEFLRTALPPGAQLAYDRLRSAVDSYAMAISGQLLDELSFERDNDGRLTDVEGRLAVCERRRKAILSAYTRLRDPIAPVFDDARIYEELADLEERKVRLIHPLEQRLDEQQQSLKNGDPAVALEWQLKQASTSPWVYDRLVFYVHAARARKFPSSADLLTALEREVSLLEARDEPATLVGLYYALEAVGRRGSARSEKTRLRDILNRVQIRIDDWNGVNDGVGPGEERVDANRKVRRLIQRLRKAAG
jgi:hypothetical protein